MDLVNIGMRVDSSQVVKGRQALKAYGDQSKKTKRATDLLSTSFGAVASAAVAMGAAVFGVIQPHREFTKSISELSAITGAVGDDLEFLRNEAIRLGGSTTFAASEVATAFKLMASANPDLLESKEALAQVAKEVLTLAEASGLGLQDSATALGGAMNQFQAGAEEASRFINVLAAGAKFGASEINDTAEALKNSGAVAATVGLSFEETNAAIQAMAAISIKGAEAGTGLRSVLIKLATQSNTQFNPEIVGLSKALDNLSGANLTTAEKTKLFGLESITAATALIEQADSVEELIKKLTDTQTAYDQASTNTNNLDGDIKALASSWSSVSLILGETFDPALRFTAKLLADIGRVAQVVVIEFKDLGNLLGSYMAQVEAVATLDFARAAKIGEMRKQERLEVEKTIDSILDQRTEYEKLADAQEKLNRIKGHLSFTAQATRKELIDEIELRKNNIAQLEEEAKAAKTSLDAKNQAELTSIINPKNNDSTAVQAATVDYSLKVDALTKSLMTEEELLGQSYADRYEMLESAIAADAAFTERGRALQLELQRKFVDEYNAIDGKERGAAERKAQQQALELDQLQQHLDREAEMFAVSQMNEEQRIGMAYAKRAEMIYQAHENELVSEALKNELLLEQEGLFRKQLAELQGRHEQEMLERSRLAAADWGMVWANTINSFSSGMGDAVANAIVDQQNLGDATRQLARSMAKEVISSLVQIGVQRTIQHVMGETMKDKEVATSVSAAAVTTAAWAPAAAVTSAATFGSSAAAGLAALVAIMAFSSKIGGGHSSSNAATSSATASGGVFNSYSQPSLPQGQSQASPAKQITISLDGDEDDLITRGAVRRLIERIRDELGDGVVGFN